MRYESLKVDCGCGEEIPVVVEVLPDGKSSHTIKKCRRCRKKLHIWVCENEAGLEIETYNT